MRHAHAVIKGLRPRALGVLVSGALGLAAGPLYADEHPFCEGFGDLSELHETLTGILQDVVAEDNAGLGFDMWATVVDRDGFVCAVTRSGDPGEQWPGSRVISAQKANTANAFSLPGFALSTANLYSVVQPGGSLYGLQHSNPVDTNVAYEGDSGTHGTADDDLVGQKIGGVNVFGGGLGLYDAGGELLGGIGVSGDTSCTDHVVAWKVRHELEWDFVPAGVADGTDNIIFDIRGAAGNFQSRSGFGHPDCGGGVRDVVADLPPTSSP
jgi:uncharacterized protein GlcG (DUF336 family)